jgi:hypothetical protein
MEARLAMPRTDLEIGGAEALRRGGKVDPFEQARLAGAIAAEQQVRTFAWREGPIGEVAEGARGYGDEQGRAPLDMHRHDDAEIAQLLALDRIAHALAFGVLELEPHLRCLDGAEKVP